MSDEIYEKLADQLNALANAFPRTQSGIEIRILKKIVPVEEARIAGSLTREFETAQEISSRLGIPIESLKETLNSMIERGLLYTSERDGVRRYRLRPYWNGLNEAQLHRMDHQLAHLYEQYWMTQGVVEGIFGSDPPIHRVLPARSALGEDQVIPYEDARALFLRAKSFYVDDCACRVEHDYLGDRKCTFPLMNCLAFFMEEREPEADKRNLGARRISQEEALAILDEAERVGLVHTTRNSIDDLYYMCNCCGCCCPVLRGINEWGITSVTKSNYLAQVEPENCTGCEVCVERCQIKAIAMDGEVAKVDLSRCIGCGLCVTGCPADAVHLHRKPEAEIATPAENFRAWEDARLKNRGPAASEPEPAAVPVTVRVTEER